MAAFTRQRSAVRLNAAFRTRATCICPSSRRHFLSWFRKPAPPPRPEHVPLLTQDNLFHPFSESPFPMLRARGEAIKKIAPCPVCTTAQEQGHPHVELKNVAFECPDCGWPTHCSEEHWKQDEEHEKYCTRLRESNEDEHDLRSGRRMVEFELPGPQPYEEAISFSNWDVFWYTRGFMSMDTERSRRLASKLLSYPITIGGALHQFSPLMLSNQRLTPEGSRSMAALRTTLHVPLGAPETGEAQVGKPQVRIFILGARAESSLPVHVWEQLCLLFPAAQLHIFFIGPQVSLPKPDTPPPPPQFEPPTPPPNATPEAAPSSDAASQLNTTPPTSDTALQTSTTTPPVPASPLPPLTHAEKMKQIQDTHAEKVKELQNRTEYLPNVYKPPPPVDISREKYTRNAINRYGVPSYTTPYTKELTVTGMRTNYIDVHHHFSETLDPYSDAFFFFSPGFGFPSENSFAEDGVTPLPQIASPTEWGPVLPAILESKCPVFVTGFSPADVERDVRSLSEAPDVAGQFEWVVMPGPNTFSSEKWEISDFDPRVMIKANWGIWAIRGRSKDIQERSMLDGLLPWRQ
ncbi:zinc-finger of mitochondrial splicing suppressor 51-domain-containing protein [Mycena alexandri]|uniref:Zinc-finger of mitochondrial splicing suppressor 51-domain-containing protein n=1 Tax=Mycena alexandri TaxID=1745969 RepID=A0AAD6TB31_9AGAR|nr:zinc-finger of mitochondrial splicing suppressor 51-domain-containing protein [Mycena alexandri]